MSVEARGDRPSAMSRAVSSGAAHLSFLNSNRITHDENSGTLKEY
jgi:hypothetical protein